MEKLRECPFCGGAKAETDACGFGNYTVDCMKCGAKIGQFAGVNKAVAAWNTRASDNEIAELRAEVERLRYILDGLIVENGFGSHVLYSPVECIRCGEADWSPVMANGEELVELIARGVRPEGNEK